MAIKTTKRALLSSVIALLVCFTMLLGTTFAWFTDSAASTGNKITAGTLDVDLFQWTSADENGRREITANPDPVFDANIIWEPGRTEVVYLSIKNNGTLALKYKVAIEVTEVSEDSLTDVMSYVITPDAKYGDVKKWEGNGTYVTPGANETSANNVTLLPGDEHFFALSVHMDEEAGNAYQGESITFDIKVLAGQLSYEEDSFGPTYDTLAGYPGTGYAAPMTENEAAKEIQIVAEDGYKVGSVIIPKDAADPNATGYTAKITKSFYEGNFTIDDDMTVVKYDIVVEGLKEGNTTPVKVQVRIPAGIDPETVKLYHYDTEITDKIYNPHTGYITFETATFSPFSIVYDADAAYVPPVIPEGATHPTAKVTYEEQYVNADLPWSSYGQWSPTAGLEAYLEAAFTFECPDYEKATDEEKKIIEAYRNWYCDFFVSLDQDLGENEIFLGGNYGDFGWIGFHNGGLTLEANTELPLLSSVTTNPWRYEDVESLVKAFLCGVGDVDDALEGATFTVKLRLINPAMVDTTKTEWWTTMTEDAYIDVNVVTYTFGGSYTIQ